MLTEPFKQRARWPVSSSWKDDTNPVIGVPPAWPHPNPTTSQRPRLQSPSRGVLEFQHRNAGDRHAAQPSLTGTPVTGRTRERASLNASARQCRHPHPHPRVRAEVHHRLQRAGEEARGLAFITTASRRRPLPGPCMGVTPHPHGSPVRSVLPSFKSLRHRGRRATFPGKLGTRQVRGVA